MQLLLDLISYLEVNNLVQGDGIDTFRDYTPDDPDEVVVIYEYTGAPFPDTDTNATHRSLQISVRSVSSDDAKGLARDICDSLRTETNYVQLTETTWSLIYIRNAPVKIKVDDRNRSTYAFNIGITSSM